MKESVVFFLSNCPQELTLFKTNLLNIIFDGFGIWLLGYMIKLSCLFNSQGYYCISTLWLWTIDYYGNFWFWAKVNSTVSKELNLDFLRIR